MDDFEKEEYVKKTFDQMGQTFQKTHKRQKHFTVLFAVVFGFALVMIFGNFFLFFNVMNKTHSIIDEVTTDNQFDVHAFNSIYELYSGTSSTIQVEALLDEVVTNNKKSNEHIITVAYQKTRTKDPNKIVDIKHSLEDFSDYEVYLSYDKEGYVNYVTIEAQ